MTDVAARRIGRGSVALLLVAAAVIAYLVTRGESHARPDPSLAELADGARVVARYDDCSDYSGVGYVKNNSCIDYLLVQSPQLEPARTLLKHEVTKLDRRNWHLFSPADFGSHPPVVARTDLYGHDCLLLGPPAAIPFAQGYRDSQRATSWAALRHRYTVGQTHPGPIIALKFYTGPANDPYHRTC